MAGLVQGPKKPPSMSALKTQGLSQLKNAAALGAVDLFENLTGIRFDPAPAYLFFVELEGIAVALFTECSGIEVKREVEDWVEGGNNNFVHKMPGRMSYSNIKLKRGLSVSRQLWDWFHEGQYDFRARRINFSIIQGAPGHNLLTALTGAAGANSSVAFSLLGKGFGKVKHWDVLDAFPVSWKGPELSASSTNVAIEEIEIAHHGIELSWYDIGTPLNPAASVAATITSQVG